MAKIFALVFLRELKDFIKWGYHFESFIRDKINDGVISIWTTLSFYSNAAYNAEMKSYDPNTRIKYFKRSFNFYSDFQW